MGVAEATRWVQLLLQLQVPVVTDDRHTHQHAAADRHGDDEGQQVGALPCRHTDTHTPLDEVCSLLGGWSRVLTECTTGRGQRGQCGLQVYVAEVSVAALDGPSGLSHGGVLCSRKPIRALH